MKSLPKLIVVMLCPFLLQAQQEIQAEHQLLSNDNIQRYGLDYELINYTFVNGDSTILLDLDLESMIAMRHESQDKIMVSFEYKVEILIYSEIRAIDERGGLTVIDETTRKSTKQ